MAIPDQVNTVGNYGIAILGGITNATMAQIFMNYWSTTDGQTYLKNLGSDNKTHILTTSPPLF